MKKIKIGILQVNHDKSETIGDTFPDDAHRFRDLFDTQFQRFEYTVYMTIGGILPKNIDEQDCYLITGSPLSVRDNLAFKTGLYKFIIECDAAKKPLLGVCFGHQAIADALGGKVEKSNIEWNIGIENISFPERRLWMTDHSSLDLFVFHEDQVTYLPESCVVIGSSERCPISSFQKGSHILTTQSHPEFSHEFMDALLIDCKGKIGDQYLNYAKKTLSKSQNGQIFSTWATEFFLENINL